jgi:hypothetical protein
MKKALFLTSIFLALTSFPAQAQQKYQLASFVACQDIDDVNKEPVNISNQFSIAQGGFFIFVSFSKVCADLTAQITVTKPDNSVVTSKPENYIGVQPTNCWNNQAFWLFVSNDQMGKYTANLKIFGEAPDRKIEIIISESTTTSTIIPYNPADYYKKTELIKYWSSYTSPRLKIISSFVDSPISFDLIVRIKNYNQKIIFEESSEILSQPKAYAISDLSIPTLCGSYVLEVVALYIEQEYILEKRNFCILSRLVIKK